MTSVLQNSSQMIWNRSEGMAVKIMLQEYQKLSENEKVLISAILMRKLEVIDTAIDYLLNPQIHYSMKEKFQIEFKLLNEHRLRQLFPILQNPHLTHVTAFEEYYRDLFKLPLIFALKLCENFTREATPDHHATKIEVVRNLVQRVEDLHAIHFQSDAALNLIEYLNKILGFAAEINNPIVRHVLMVELENAFAASPAFQ